MPYFKITHIGYDGYEECFHDVFTIESNREPTEQECRTRLFLMTTPPDGDDLSIYPTSVPPIWSLPV